MPAIEPDLRTQAVSNFGSRLLILVFGRGWGRVS